MRTHPTHFLVGATLLILLILTFSTSCMLATAGVPGRMTEGERSSTATAIMGAARMALSSWLYSKADLYFHKGKPRQVETAFKDSFFQKICSELSPTETEHRSGDEFREIMPWLWLAVRSDPQNIDNYVIASFWLAHENGRPDLARSVLARARWNNPFSYHVAMEDAILALWQGDTDEASSLLNAGLAFWDRSANSEDMADLNNRSRMLLYRSLLFEAQGRKEDAVAMLQEILRLFPERRHIEARIAKLRSEGQPSLLASSKWNDILKKDIKNRKEQAGCEDHEHGSHLNSSHEDK